VTPSAAARLAGRIEVVGVVNVSEDSFSDGAAFLAPRAALRHAHRLLADGAGWIELGPAASHPSARRVPPAEQIRRIAPLLARLATDGARVAVDSSEPLVQRFAAENGAALLNDVRGFPNLATAARSAALGCRLVVMHSLGGRHRARPRAVRPRTVLASVDRFLERRIAALQARGVPREALIVDPGMGYFLGTTPDLSLAVLRRLASIRARLALPVLVSVSRKSFVQRLTGRTAREAGAGSLAAELYAVAQGADWIRTHDPRALCDALAVLRPLCR
jgi:dihydropteroate synthase type 2